MLFGLFGQKKDVGRPAPRYVVSHKYDDPQLGPVAVTVRANARRFTARWHGRTLSVTVPPRTTPDRLAEAMATMMPRLVQNRPSTRFEVGVPFGPPDFRVTIEREPRLGPRSMVLGRDRRIFISKDFDLDDPQCEKALTRLLRTMCARAFDDIILPRAVELAARVGVSPRSISRSSGSTRLGTCNTRGEIRLSCVLVLLPSELRDYVILHEFAHLTEMNHSPRFYALLDRYCGGRNAILRRALKSAVLPV